MKEDLESWNQVTELSMIDMISRYYNYMFISARNSKVMGKTERNRHLKVFTINVQIFQGKCYYNM
jgi:hypothetical protein